MTGLNKTDELLQLIHRSGLLDQRLLAEHLEKLAEGGSLPEEPKALVELLVRDGLLTKFQAQQLLAGKHRGFVILGKYKILDVLGAGGMGKVLLCEHIMLRRLVAIKLLPRAKTNNEVSVKRFYREARAVAALDHPNIVRCFDVDRDGPVHFMVMEYVSGASLDAVIERSGPLESSRAAHYIRQAAMGLQHAHEAGWVHRDVKPANILLDRSGAIKLLDLGLARLFEDTGDNLTRQFSDRAVLGTADYIAPEQAVSSHSADIRADIYSLGATFFFLLAGRPPFKEGTLAQKLIWHQTRIPPSLRELRPEIPEGLEAVVAKMLAKHPAERYQTPVAVAEALHPWTAVSILPPSEKEMPVGVSSVALGLTDPLNAPPAGLGQILGFDSSSNVSEKEGKNSSASEDTITVNIRIVTMPPDSPTGGPEQTPQQISAPEKTTGRPPTIKTLKLPPAGPADTVRSSRLPKEGAVSTMKVAALKIAPPATSTAPLHTKRRSPRPVLLFAAMILVATGFAAAYWIGFFSMPQGSGTPANSVVSGTSSGTDRRTLSVTRNKFSPLAGKPNTYPSIRQALENARAGDHIAVLDEFYEERLVLNGLLVGDLVLESGTATGKPVNWNLPADSTERGPLLTLNEVTGLTIRGIHLDAQQQVEDLVHIAGRCPGLRLENLQLRGFSRAGVRMLGASGRADRPLALHRVRFMNATKKEIEAALIFSTPRAEDAPSEYVTIQGSRFEGPYQAAVQLNGSVLATEFRGNRFFSAGAGFEYRSPRVDDELRLTVAGNTFSNLEALLRLESFPKWAEDGSGSRVVLTGNLLAHTPHLLVTKPGPEGKQLATLFPACEFNVRDKDSDINPVPYLPAQLMAFELPTDPGNESRFLRYAPNSPLMKAGPNGQPVGAPPE